MQYLSAVPCSLNATVTVPKPQILRGFKIVVSCQVNDIESLPVLRTMYPGGMSVVILQPREICMEVPTILIRPQPQ